MKYRATPELNTLAKETAKALEQTCKTLEDKVGLTILFAVYMADAIANKSSDPAKAVETVLNNVVDNLLDDKARMMKHYRAQRDNGEA